MVIEVKIPNDNIINALKSAVAGGIYYWCSGFFRKLPQDIPEENQTVYDNFRLPFFGGSIGFEVSETGIVYYIDLNSLDKGLKIMAQLYPSEFSKLLHEKGWKIDAPTGDILVQCCIFGEIRYVN